MKPVIGIPASNLVTEGGLHSGDRRYFAGSDYIEAVAAEGGIAVILPPADEPAWVRELLSRVDGLMLIGGYDLDPALYGREPLPQLGPVFPERDGFEMALVRLAGAERIPVLGICRGIQVINVAFGGSLLQDLSELGVSLLQHYQNSCKHVPGHTVNIEQDTLLRHILGLDHIRTNSYHHQAVAWPASGFAVSAQTRDGVVEAIENPDMTMLGVQWHPEMMRLSNPAMAGLFRWLVDAARNRRNLERSACNEP